MRRIATMAVLAAVAVAGCTATQDAGTGQFELLVSDQPAAIDDFSSLDVTFSEARVFPGEGPNETEGDYVSFDLNGSTADLTELPNASAQSLVQTSLPADNYSKIELHVSDATGVVDGSEVDVKVPSEKLMVTVPFTVEPNSTVRFVFDMHVVQRGTGGYILRPVIAHSGVVGHHVGQPQPPQDAGGGQGPPGR